MDKNAENSDDYGETEPELRPEFIEKIEKIKKGKFIKIEDFAKHYGLK